MESKEATSHPIAEVSSGYSPSSSYLDNSENGTFLNKTIALNDNSDDISMNDDSKGAVSEDEGYVSGYEEFETESDKPVLDETVVGEGNSDAPEKIESLPISGVSVNDVDDDDGKGSKDIEGDENGGGKDFESVDDGVEGFDSNGEILDSRGVKSDEGVVESGGEIVEGKAGEVVIGEVEMKGEDSEDKEKSELDSQVAVGEPEELESGDVKTMPEGDSVIDTIQVDVAGPGVAVVGEVEENGDVASKPVEEVIAEVAVSESEIPEVVSLGDVNANEGDSVVVEKTEEIANKSEPEEVAEAVVKTTPEGDSVVDAIQVDTDGSGVAVVGEIKVPIESVGDVVEKEISTGEVGVGDNTVDENSNAGGVVDLVNGVHISMSSDDSVDNSGKKPEEKYDEPALISENGTTAKISTDDEEGRIVDEVVVGSERDVNHLDISNDVTNGDHSDVLGLAEGKSEESKPKSQAVVDSQEIRDGEDEMDEEVHSISDGEDSTDGMIFGSSEAAKKFIEELERESGGGDSHDNMSLDQPQRIDGQIVTDSEEEEEGETDDDEGDGKELFDSAALAALLKAATGADSDGGPITITSRDGSRLFSVDRPAGLGSSLQSLRPPAPRRPTLFSTVTPASESEENLSEEEKKKLEKLQQIRVKFLRLVHRLGLSPEESVAAQVLYRLTLLGGRQGTQSFSLDAAKSTALQLESGGEEKDDLDFSINILVLGKSGVGKSATINSLFGEEKAPIDAFGTGTNSAREISGLIDGVKVRVVDTPGLKSSVMEQGFNHGILSSAKKLIKKNTPDVILYVDRLDAQSRDLNDLPLLKTVTTSLGPSTWRNAVVTLTHAASAPPEGPSGAPLSYEVFVSQRSHVVQQSIGHAVGDLRMMSPSLMNPVSLVENHPSCRKNREGQKILPNGQSWRPQLLLLCYAMKILSEASSSLSKPQDPFDHRKLFGFRARSPPLPYMLSSMLQSRPHPKLQSDENADSDVDLDDLSDSDGEEEDEYDQLPPFKPLRKAQIARLTKEQKKAYFEEYDYRVKLLQKKQWREELRRTREMKKNGGAATVDYGEEEGDSGAAAPVAVPLPDMALPASFDGDNPAYRYRFLEPASQFLARPVLDSHGWDHDCGYDGVNLEHSLAVLSRFPATYTVQVTKDKKDFTVSLDSSISAKHGENMSTMAGFDIQSMGKQLAYIVRAETKCKDFGKKKNIATGGVSFTFLGENVVPGLKIEDQIQLGKQYALVGSVGAVRSQQDTAYGANFEVQRREVDYPIGQVQSTVSMSVVNWRGDLALGFNGLTQISLGRNSKVAVRAGINNKRSGQITVRTSSSEHLSLALAAVIPAALSIYRKLYPGEKYAIY